MTTAQPLVPNHHASFPGFAGPAGFLAALSMAAGGKGNARLAERLSDLTAGDAVADIGCGPGTAARHAARLGAQVFAIDPAPVMLRLARLLSPRPARDVRYLHGSAEAVPLPDSSVFADLCHAHGFTDAKAGRHEGSRRTTVSVVATSATAS